MKALVTSFHLLYQPVSDSSADENERPMTKLKLDKIEALTVWPMVRGERYSGATRSCGASSTRYVTMREQG
eukprot:839352-Prymnesium_polylepis.1